VIISGIGSRETPLHICAEMTKIGVWCREHGHIVRSGHAIGADWAFEQGALKNCEVFLPWTTYNRELPVLGRRILPVLTAAHYATVDKYHPAPSRLTSGARSMHARNACQIFGEQLNDPVTAVVCWRIKSGGTDQAIRIAQGHGIPVLNMSLLQFNTAEKVIARLESIS
jgi:hypothetical protein